MSYTWQLELWVNVYLLSAVALAVHKAGAQFEDKRVQCYLHICDNECSLSSIEKVSVMGGFHYKDWVISGQDVKEQLISVKLPNQIGADE